MRREEREELPCVGSLFARVHRVLDFLRQVRYQN